jgi:hypothetical protein
MGDAVSRVLPPCRCRHPGLGCTCFPERLAEIQWDGPERTLAKRESERRGRTTPWLGVRYRPETRPVQSSTPTAREVAETVLQELRDPGYMVSFYEGDDITVNEALRILAEEVLR